MMAYHSVLSDGALAVLMIYYLTRPVKRVAAKRKVYDAVITNFPDTQSAQAAETKLAEINNSGN